MPILTQLWVYGTYVSESQFIPLYFQGINLQQDHTIRATSGIKTLEIKFSKRQMLIPKWWKGFLKKFKII